MTTIHDTVPAMEIDSRKILALESIAKSLAIIAEEIKKGKEEKDEEDKSLLGELMDLVK